MCGGPCWPSPGSSALAAARAEIEARPDRARPGGRPTDRRGTPEHILAKLLAPTRTLAAVRAERAGLYVPREQGTAPAQPAVPPQPANGPTCRPACSSAVRTPRASSTAPGVSPCTHTE